MCASTSACSKILPLAFSERGTAPIYLAISILEMADQSMSVLMPQPEGKCLILLNQTTGRKQCMHFELESSIAMIIQKNSDMASIEPEML